MSYNAAITARVQDQRCAPMPIGTGMPPSIVADALLDGGYGARLSIVSGNVFGTTATVAMAVKSPPTQSLAVGYTERVWTDHDFSSWFTGGVLASADGLLPILCMDNFSDGTLETAIRTNAGLTTTRPSRCVFLAVDRALNVYLYMNENGTVTVSGVLATITATKHDFELSATFVAGPHLSISARVDKAPIGTLTSANPTIGWSIQCARCGWLDNNAIPPAGNGTGTLLWGNLFRSDSAGNAPTGWPLDLPAGAVSGPHAEVLLPNGDGATLQWLTNTGATGTYTTWNEAVGAWTTGDTTYNHAGAGAAQADQQSTFANSARPAADVNVGVALVGEFTLPAGGPTASQQFVINDGIESAKGVNYPDAAQGQGLAQSHWSAPPSGGTWSVAASNGLTHTARRTNLDATDWQVRTWYKLLWYYTGQSGFAHSQVMQF